MDGTSETYNEGDHGPVKEFGFRASGKDDDSGSGEEESKILDDEVNAFKENIKVGEQKPNMTVSLDKSDVEGTDSTASVSLSEDEPTPKPEQKLQSEMENASAKSEEIDMDKEASDIESEDEKKATVEEQEEGEEESFKGNQEDGDEGSEFNGSVNPTTRMLKGIY